MKEEEALKQALALVNRSRIAILGTIDAEGFPNIRGLMKAENEGLKRIWFSTNTSSRKIPQLKANSKTCVYFVDFEEWMGLMLIGTIEILQDPESRRRIWREGDEKYYPLGVDDPDYSVLRFTAKWGRYYHASAYATFEL
ncbi:MAG: pyridoxamine 5'-phosphate oxidase family protein [bacterium]